MTGITNMINYPDPNPNPGNEHRDTLQRNGHTLTSDQFHLLTSLYNALASTTGVRMPSCQGAVGYE